LDGTFAHDWTDLDQAVNPGGDSANNGPEGGASFVVINELK
jgi:hypothetical protein